MASLDSTFHTLTHTHTHIPSTSYYYQAAKFILPLYWGACHTLSQQGPQPSPQCGAAHPSAAKQAVPCAAAGGIRDAAVAAAVAITADSSTRKGKGKTD